MKKIIFPVLFLVFSFSVLSGRESLAKEAKFQNEIILSYGKDAHNFKNFTLHLTPYSTYATFESNGEQEYVMDCRLISGKNAWNCFSACGGGDFTLFFSSSKGFSEIKIDPFSITPRLCDGSENADDPKLTSRKPLLFKLKQMR